MTYTLPAWVDAPATTTAVSATNLLLFNAAINDLDTRANNGPASGYGHNGPWGTRVYGDLMTNINRDDADDIYAPTATTRTLLILFGLSPAGTYAAFRLFVTIAMVGGTTSAALFSAANRTDTNWTRLGSGNVSPVLTSTGLVSTNLAFTLVSDQWVMLELVLTGTAPTTYPTLAAGAVGVAGLLNPPSGAPVSASANLTAAPTTPLNPTTGFTNLAQKVWAALA